MIPHDRKSSIILIIAVLQNVFCFHSLKRLSSFVCGVWLRIATKLVLILCSRDWIRWIAGQLPILPHCYKWLSLSIFLTVWRICLTLYFRLSYWIMRWSMYCRIDVVLRGNNWSWALVKWRYVGWTGALSKNSITFLTCDYMWWSKRLTHVVNNEVIIQTFCCYSTQQADVLNVAEGSWAYRFTNKKQFLKIPSHVTTKWHLHSLFASFTHYPLEL